MYLVARSDPNTPKSATAMKTPSLSPVALRLLTETVNIFSTKLPPPSHPPPIRYHIRIDDVSIQRLYKIICNYEVFVANNKGKIHEIHSDIVDQAKKLLQHAMVGDDTLADEIVMGFILEERKGIEGDIMPTRGDGVTVGGALHKARLSGMLGSLGGSAVVKGTNL